MVMQLHRHGFLLGEAGGEEVNLAYGELLQAQADELTEVVDKTLDEIKKIDEDSGLNARGKQERMRTAANKDCQEIHRLAAQHRGRLAHDAQYAEGKRVAPASSALSLFDYNVKRAEQILRNASGTRLRPTY